MSVDSPEYRAQTEEFRRRRQRARGWYPDRSRRWVAPGGWVFRNPFRCRRLHVSNDPGAIAKARSLKAKGSQRKKPVPGWLRWAGGAFLVHLLLHEVPLLLAGVWWLLWGPGLG